MDDASDSLAFRRLVASITEKLTDEEVRKLVYIRLYTQREALFRDTNKLDVFVALEYAEVFSPSRPEGLLNILEKDLKNRPLAQMVKDFIRQKKNKSVDDLSAARCGVSAEIEAESHLRMCYKVALAQTNVLVKHLDILRLAVTGEKIEVEGAQKAVENMSKTAEAIAKLREKAIEEEYDYQEDYQEDYDDVESRNPMTEDVAEPCPVQVNFSAIPPPAKKKPELKPKPKLKVLSWNASSSGFNSTVSTSLPLLDSISSPPQATDDGDEGIDDDYIIPTLYPDDVFDGEIDRGQLPPNSTLPTKANSLPYLNLPPNISQEVRPLPDLPTDQQDELCGDVNGYTPIKPDNEDYEPIYDDITEHTLLSRIGKPS